MRYRQWAAVSLLACGLAAVTACSDEEAPVADTSTPVGNGICIQSDQIDHTDIPDDSTILFHMKGGLIWKNSLRFACTSLKSEGGFAYVIPTPKICSDAQTIRVLRSGILCELGEFTPYTPPPTAPAPATAQ